MGNVAYAKIDNKGDRSPNVLVIGDVMLDNYIMGECLRMSPEAPVPVMTKPKSHYQAGGAANVALNLKSLGCNVTLMGITGRDKYANHLQDLCDGYVYVHFQKVSDIRTTRKTRYFCNGQQMGLNFRQEHLGSRPKI